MDQSTPRLGTEQHNRAPADTDVIVGEWVVHLLASQPSRLWGVLAGIVIAAAFGVLALRHWLGAVLGAGFVLSAVWEFLFPIRYRLSCHGASCTYGLAHLEIPWSRVRRVIRLSDGVRLSPFPHPTRLDAFRGVHIRYPAADQSITPHQVEAWIRECMETHRHGG